MNTRPLSSVDTLSPMPSEGTTDSQGCSTEAPSRITDVTGDLHQSVSSSSLSHITSSLPAESRNISEHTITDVSDPSSPSPCSSSSPSSFSDEDFQHLERLEQKKISLEEKIKSEKGVILPDNLEGHVEIKEHQERYIKNLGKALVILQKTISVIHDAHELSSEEGAKENIEDSKTVSLNSSEESYERLNEMGKAADLIVQLAGEIKSYADQVTITRIERIRKKLPIKEELAAKELLALGEAHEAICHYVDYADAIKTKAGPETNRHFYLGNRCFSLFKALQAGYSDKQDKDLARAYDKAHQCYRNAAAAEIGFPYNDLPYSKEDQEVAMYLAQTAGAKINVPCSEELAMCLAKAGDYFFRAGKELENGNHHLAKLSQLIGECHQEWAEAANLHNKNIMEFLGGASDFYIKASEALLQDDVLLSKVYESIGRSLQESARAIRKDKMEVAELYFQTYKALNKLVKIIKDPVNDKMKASLYNKAASCFFEAAKALSENKQELSYFYEQAGESSEQAASTNDQTALFCFNSLAESYLNRIDVITGDIPVTPVASQYWSSSTKYALEAKTAVETLNGTTDSAALKHVKFLTTCVSSLQKAATLAQQGDEVSAQRYHLLAESQYRYANAIKPLPGSKPNWDLITYWENILKSHEFEVMAMNKDEVKSNG